MVPPEHHKQLANLKKTRERQNRKKLENYENKPEREEMEIKTSKPERLVYLCNLFYGNFSVSSAGLHVLCLLALPPVSLAVQFSLAMMKTKINFRNGGKTEQQ